MSTFRDFLTWYNKLEVGPFVEAVQRFQAFYFDKGIDVSNTAISVHGIARQLLFRCAKQQNANFALFDKDNADLYQTLKQNIIVRPSIIFTRHHKAKETREAVRSDSMIRCQRLVSRGYWETYVRGSIRKEKSRKRFLDGLADPHSRREHLA